MKKQNLLTVACLSSFITGIIVTSIYYSHKHFIFKKNNKNKEDNLMTEISDDSYKLEPPSDTNL